MATDVQVFVLVRVTVNAHVFLMLFIICEVGWVTLEFII